jgi:hypothetical protein
VYLHILNWPGRKLRFEGLASDVKRAYFLANKQTVAFRRAGAALEFDLPEKAIDPHNTVLALEIADQQPRVTEGYRNNTLPKRLDLHSWTARFRGEELRYDKASLSVSNFRKAAQFENELWLYPYESLEGEYEFELTYACDDAAAGSAFRIGVHKGNQGPYQELRGRVEGTGGKFAAKKVNGSLRISRGDQHVSFALPDDDKSAAIRIQKLTLTRR